MSGQVNDPAEVAALRAVARAAQDLYDVLPGFGLPDVTDDAADALRVALDALPDVEDES